MDFYVMAKSHNTYGGHMSLFRIGDFLLQGAPHYGDAIREITAIQDSRGARTMLARS